ncbi:hypothetical protein G6F57_022688 [Rhizopus arrhizus]|nr:hypothetical protein G6F57_022688 [Rhizopus arrhizus]
MPVVSHRVMPSTPSAAKRPTSSSTSKALMSPSIGQPKTVDSDTLTATRLPRTTLTTSLSCSNDCSRVMRRLARLWVSLTDITRLTSSTLHSSARCAPRTLGTSTV